MKKLLRLTTMLLALLPLTACGVSSKPIEGQVVDAETKKPIAGAIVIARWRGTYSALVDTHTSCYHVETATTDKDGYYKIPGWWEMPKGPFFSEDSMVLDAYKPGYEKYWPVGYDRTEDFKNNVLYLMPFKGTKEERLKYLMHMSGLAECYAVGDAKVLFPIQKALYQEANGIASTAQDQDAVQWIRRKAVLSWKRSEVALTDSEVDALIRNDPFLKEQLK